MNSQNPELLEKIRQQFDSQPYPKTPIEISPKEDFNGLFLHNFLTPHYLRNQKLVNPTEVAILDVGCGSGYKTLILAEANPGATIIGIDLSEQSVSLARERLKFHGFPEVQFYRLPLDEVAQLGMKFDYINCDEILYLMPDLTQALKILKTALKPTGILRGNLHSLYQRHNFFRSQQLFHWMGLMDGNPEATEISIVLDTMKALKDDVPLKRQTWSPQQAEERPEEYVLMNYLFQGDKGYTLEQLFEALRGASLEFICMVNQRDWDLMSLFQDPQALPEAWSSSLPQLSMEDRLQLFELISPVHRLLDFWCGHLGQTPQWEMPRFWQTSEWEHVRVHLHPQLKSAIAKSALIASIQQQQSFDLSQYLTGAAALGSHVLLSPNLASALLPLWDAPQMFSELVDRILTIRPCDPVTLEPTDPHQAAKDLRDSIVNLELSLHVLLERTSVLQNATSL
ncbi:methyltransferase type 11 [Leptolyngbya sp. NIES-3755]|nr:methyltransferase type 11 [Leptolyngbya sp. NIES-3755]